MTRAMLIRAVPLDDIKISREGDGRTVTAYAAMFDSAYEVRDQFGHYYETINRSAFDRTLKQGRQPVCLFNHGMTVQHTPSEKWSSGLGVPLEIKPDARGLLTVTRYNKTAQADEVLELIRSGTVTNQSFQGPIFRSAAPRPYAQSRLPLIERTELGLLDYGPCTIAVAPAQIMAVRSLTELREEIAELDEEERLALLAELATNPADPEPNAATTQPAEPPTPEPAPEEVAPPGTPKLSEWQDRIKDRHRDLDFPTS